MFILVYLNNKQNDVTKKLEGKLGKTTTEESKKIQNSSKFGKYQQNSAKVQEGGVSV